MTAPIVARDTRVFAAAVAASCLCLSLGGCEGGPAPAPSGAASTSASAATSLSGATQASAAPSSALSAMASASPSASAGASALLPAPGVFAFIPTPTATNVTAGPIRGVFDGKPFAARVVEVDVEPEDQKIEVLIKGTDKVNMSLTLRDKSLERLDQALTHVAADKTLTTTGPDGKPARGGGSVWVDGGSMWGLGSGFYVIFTARTSKPYNRAKKGSQEVGTVSGRLFVTYDLHENTSPPMGEAGCSGEFTDAIVTVKASSKGPK